MNMLEKKKMVAKWMGWTWCWQHHFRKSEHWKDIHPWFPEKGGRDLAEVLNRFKDEQRVTLYRLLPGDFYIGNGDEIYEIMISVFWFQDPENAPAIFDAVCEVVKEVMPDG